MRATLSVALCILLGACAHGHGGPGDVAVGAGCPGVKRYSKSRQASLGAELKVCGTACRAIAGALADYHVLRQQVRACRRKN